MQGLNWIDCHINSAYLFTLIYQNKINSTIAQQILEKMYQTGKDPSVIMEEDDLTGGADGDASRSVTAGSERERNQSTASSTDGAT